MFAEQSSCGHSLMFSEHSRKTFRECFANIYRTFAQKHSPNVFRTFVKYSRKTFRECFANLYTTFAQKHSANVFRTFVKYSRKTFAERFANVQKTFAKMLSRYSPNVRFGCFEIFCCCLNVMRRPTFRKCRHYTQYISTSLIHHAVH